MFYLPLILKFALKAIKPSGHATATEHKTTKMAELVQIKLFDFLQLHYFVPGFLKCHDIILREEWPEMQAWVSTCMHHK